MTNVKTMPNVEQATANQEQELSQEELTARRAEITSFYKENIKSLKVQLEYEQLLTNVEKTRAERLQAQVFIAQTYAQQNPNANAAENPTEAGEEFESAKSKANETA